MAKKKEEQEKNTATVVTTEELNELKNKLKEHDQVLENFRTSFKNLETALSLLKDRNCLR